MFSATKFSLLSVKCLNEIIIRLLELSLMIPIDKLFIVDPACYDIVVLMADSSKKIQTQKTRTDEKRWVLYMFKSPRKSAGRRVKLIQQLVKLTHIIM